MFSGNLVLFEAFYTTKRIDYDYVFLRCCIDTSFEFVEIGMLRIKGESIEDTDVLTISTLARIFIYIFEKVLEAFNPFSRDFTEGC